MIARDRCSSVGLRWSAIQGKPERIDYSQDRISHSLRLNRVAVQGGCRQRRFSQCLQVAFGDWQCRQVTERRALVGVLDHAGYSVGIERVLRERRKLIDENIENLFETLEVFRIELEGFFEPTLSKEGLSGCSVLRQLWQRPVLRFSHAVSPVAGLQCARVPWAQTW